MTTLLADDASPDPSPPLAVLPVRPWPDPVIDALGHDPRSAYVERTGTQHRFIRVVFPRASALQRATVRKTTKLNVEVGAVVPGPCSSLLTEPGPALRKWR